MPRPENALAQTFQASKSLLDAILDNGERRTRLAGAFRSLRWEDYMVRQSARQKSSRNLILFICGLVILASIAYFAFDYVRDSQTYNAGVAAYMEGDCERALEEFSDLADGGAFGSYAELISDKNIQCQTYLRRVGGVEAKSKAGDAGGAFLEYVGFLQEQHPEPIVTNARIQAQTLLIDAGIELFRDPKVCNAWPEILQAKILPNEKDFLPVIYLYCGMTYDAAEDTQKSIVLYEKFLAEFPEHEFVDQVEQLVIKHPFACSYYTNIHNSIVANDLDILEDFSIRCIKLLLKLDNSDLTLEANEIQNFTTEQYQQLVDFLGNYPDNELAMNVESALMQTQAACDDIASLKSNSQLSMRDDFLPKLYLECGNQFIDRGMYASTIDIFQEFLEEFPDHELIHEIRVLYVETLQEEYPDQNIALIDMEPYIEDLLEIYNPVNAQSVEEIREFSDARYGILLDFLINYPDHELNARVEDIFVKTRIACNKIASLKANTELKARLDFLPKLYYECGQRFDGPAAIDLFEDFLEEYPDHPLHGDVKKLYADRLFSEAGSGSGSISPPERSGYTGNTFASVIIQNDSPYELRIAFRGADIQVETIPACESCQEYRFSPPFCPKQGPIVEFELLEGEYEVLVDSQGGRALSWTGSWALVSGEEYYNCFLIITRTIP